jgi:PAS domain S-box-containing protein
MLRTLRESERRLEEAQRLTHVGYWERDPETDLITWSDETYRIFGLQPQARTLNLAQLPDLIHPEDQQIMVQAVAEALRGGRRYDVEYRVVRPDGEVRVVHSQGDVIRDESGRPRRMFGTVQDITERKRAEEALQQAQAALAHVTRVTTLGELTASIAHEVNQPLAGVVTNAQACLRWLAGDPPDLEEARECLRRIIRDGHRAGDVITRLRALAKKSPPAKAGLDLNDTIRDVLLITNAEARRQQVFVRTDLAAALPPLWGDRVQLQQVLLNLVMNGIEAMREVEERPRELLIRSRLEASRHVLVAVHDRGIGLDEQRLERIFEAFYTTKPDGLGMGLSISRSIIEAHGGRLWATPHDGPGATVQFTLPLPNAQQA